MQARAEPSVDALRAKVANVEKAFNTSLYEIDACVLRTDKELVVALVEGWPIFWVLVQLVYRGMQAGR
jgi:hypothetical protein